MFPRPQIVSPRTSALRSSAKTTTLIRCWHKASMEKLIEDGPKAEPHANEP
jgi:hypothetical protein